MKNKQCQVLIQDEFDNLYHIGFYTSPELSIYDVNEFLSKRGLHVDKIDISMGAMRVELNELEDIRIRFIEHAPLLVVTADEYVQIMDLNVGNKDDISNADSLAELIERADAGMWDYPLEELDYCNEEGINVVKVVFEKGPSRLFEIKE